MKDGQSIYLVNLRGSLDSTTAPEFKEFLKSKKEAGYRRFLFNCESLGWLTSRGISVLLQLQQEFQESGHYMVLAGINPEIARLFTMLGLDRRLVLAPNRIEAEKILDRVELPEPVRKKSEGFRFAEEGLLVEEGEIPPAPAEKTVTSPEETEPEEIMSEPEEAMAESEEIVPEPEEVIPEPEKISHYSPHTEGEQPATIKFAAPEKPFAEKIISCESCGARLKIERAGRHKCPSCDIEFYARGSGSISWMEKL